MANPRTEKQARHWLNHYVSRKCNFKKPIRLNVSSFTDFVAEVTGWKVDVKLWRPEEGQGSLRGIILRDFQAKEALILISDTEKNNPCWKRFTTIKEVSHIFLKLDSHVECDDALVMVKNLQSVGQLTSDFMFTEDSIKRIAQLTGVSMTEEDIQAALATRNPHGVAEVSAVAAAREILLPHYLKPEVLNMSQNENKTLLEIADELKVPAFYLEKRLEEWHIPYKVD